MTVQIDYSKQRDLSRILEDLKIRLRAFEQKQEAIPSPRGAIEMMEMEKQRRVIATASSDLYIARDIIVVHFDKQFLEQAMAQARQRYQEQGISGPIKNKGWESVTLQLPGGLRLKLKTPYLRPFHQERSKKSSRSNKRGSGGSGSYPVLEALGINDSATPLTRSEVSRQVVLCSSYAEAQEQLSREGLVLDTDALVRLSTHTGEKALELRDEALQKATEEELPGESTVAGQRIRVSVDGGRARVRRTNRRSRKKKNGRRPFQLEWREPRLVTVDILDEKGQSTRCWRPIYEISLGKADEVFALLCGLLRMIGAYQAREIVFITDGAEWIWHRVEQLIKDAELPRERVHLVLDYYHASEYISKALDKCSKLNKQGRKKLFKKLCKMLLEEEGPEKVIARLEEFASGRRAKSIKKAIAYLQQHVLHMEYAFLREKGLPIGSGVVESTMRRVVNLRFKNASMCWCEERLEALLYLRAILKSGRWDDAMNSQLIGCHFLASKNKESWDNAA